MFWIKKLKKGSHKHLSKTDLCVLHYALPLTALSLYEVWTVFLIVSELCSREKFLTSRCNSKTKPFTEKCAADNVTNAQIRWTDEIDHWQNTYMSCILLCLGCPLPQYQVSTVSIIITELSCRQRNSTKANRSNSKLNRVTGLAFYTFSIWSFNSL